MESNSIALDITCTETAPCCLTMTVKVPAARAKSVYDNVTKKVASQVKVPGFRSGKIPAKILNARFGNEILAETSQRLVQDFFELAAKEKGLNLATRPQLVDGDIPEYKIGEDFSFAMHFEVFPDVVLPEYKGIQVTQNAIVVSDSEVEDALNGWLEQRSTFEKVERPAQKNDMLKLSYHADVPEELVEDKALSYLLKADNTWMVLREPEYLPGAQTALLGVAADEQKDVEISFPEDFRFEELKGKTLLYHFSVKEVQAQVMPALDEKIFQEVGVKDSEELHERIRKSLVYGKTSQEEEKVRAQVIDALLSGQDFAVPPTLLKKRKESLMENFLQSLQRDLLSDDEKNAKIAAYESEAEAQASRDLRRIVLLEKIAEVEKITGSQSEIMNVIGMMAQREGITFDVALRRLHDSGQITSLVSSIVESKAIALLVKEAVKTEVEA